jgi:hypothetical protein
VTGEDAFSFLQGQFTQDLRALPAAGSAYGLWLSLKGKMLADSFVLPGDSAREFWVGSYFSPAAVVRERLESHVIADDVTLTDCTGEVVGVTLLGAGVALPRVAGSWVFAGRRGTQPASEGVFLASGGEPAAWSGLLAGQPELSAAEMSRRRIAAGIAAVGPEVGSGDLPHEAGLEAVAVSYTKGCYLGQEVMARLHAMGQVRRRLARVRVAAGAVPAVPAPLHAAGKVVGELRSAVDDGAGGWSGLAMLTLLQVGGLERVALFAEGPADVEVLAS